ncbi:type II toxin-antitoxin system RelE/ParE family toxin [Rhodanobacter sp. 115]|uniref:type II toxin-antitoxin system RelE/ParE family toxin n=1 Tax=Rhodanobacter sp. FW021-MT20 TaxID=1162282 RepID=UPI0009DA0FF7|nr:type II toxin-antitoxin system RelE/ParE family toxin [Rhodanobacter sp. 115]
MTFTVIFAPEAIDRLDAIEQYIADAGVPVAGADYVDAIVAFCQSLATFPLRGTKRDDLVPGLRITNYRGPALESRSSQVNARCQALRNYVLRNAVRNKSSAAKVALRRLPLSHLRVELPVFGPNPCQPSNWPKLLSQKANQRPAKEGHRNDRRILRGLHGSRLIPAKL